MRLLKQSSTAQPLMFLMVQSSDHISALTGASPTVTLSKNGGSFASPSGAVTEVGSGWYRVAGNATDTNTLGPLILHATAASGDPVDIYFDVIAVDPQSATAFITGVNSLAPPANWNLLGIDSSGIAQASMVQLNDNSVAADVAAIFFQAINDSTQDLSEVGDAFADVFAYFFDNSSTLPPVASAGSLGTQAKADVNAEADAALADYDAPTNAEMVARTLASASYATAANQTAIQGATFDTATDSLEAIRNRGDVAWITATGFATSAALTTLQSDVTSILADTNELQTDWANGGRLDLLLDTTISQTTNAEIRDAVGMSLPNLDGQLLSILGQATSAAASGVAIKLVTDKLDGMLVADGLVYQFTANALELAASVDGVGDAEQATLLLVKAQTDKITTSQINTVSAYARSGITIKQGDSYVYANGTGATLIIPKPSGSTRYPSSLSGWTVTLRAQAHPDNPNSGTGTLSEVMTVTDPTTTQDLHITSLTAAETAALKIGLWLFDIIAVSGTDTRTLVAGTMKVDEAQS